MPNRSQTFWRWKSPGSGSGRVYTDATGPLSRGGISGEGPTIREPVWRMGRLANGNTFPYLASSGPDPAIPVTPATPVTPANPATWTRNGVALSANDSAMTAADSGMVSRFERADYIKEQKRGVLASLQRLWDRVMGRVPFEQTTEQGSAGAASPSTIELSLYSLRYERRSYLDECNRMWRDDVRCFRSINKFAREAVRGGFTIVIAGDVPKSRRAKAQQIAQDLQKIGNRKIQSWARSTLIDGESFLQAVVVGTAGNGRIVDVKRMPTPSMERNSNDADDFPKPEAAFSQVDVLSNQEIAVFPMALLCHLRWNWVDGERYGTPEILAARRARRLLELVEEAHARRRIARAALRYLWIIGNKENPGDWMQVQKFKEINGLVEGRRQALDPLEVGRDVFINGVGDAKVLQGDAHVHEITDIDYFQNVYASAGLPTPPALYNLAASNVNRDVLEDQRAEWLKETQVLSDLMAEGVRFLFDLALLLAGILPGQVTYKVHFSESSIETPTAIIERVIKARQAYLGTPRNGVPDPLISRLTALQQVAEFYDIEDIEAELKAIEMELSDYTDHLGGISEASRRAPVQLPGEPAGSPGQGGKTAPGRSAAPRRPAAPGLGAKGDAKRQRRDEKRLRRTIKAACMSLQQRVAERRNEHGTGVDPTDLPGALYAGKGSPVAPMNSMYGEPQPGAFTS